MITIKAFLTLNIGDIVGDYKCIDIIKKRHDGKYAYISNYYVMKCLKCGRLKEMLSSTIRLEKGITHKSCGKGLKTKDSVFYDRWQAMRTRTCNTNYEHAKHYSKKGINSDEFELFIDFYDKMYASYKELANKIGPNNVSLERIDNSKNYTVDNCIWIDKHNQPKNTTKICTFEVTFPDGHKEIRSNVREFAHIYNLNESTIRDCLNPNRCTKQHKGFKFKRVV